MKNVLTLPNGRKWESSSGRPPPPRRKPNSELRSREHLTAAEVDKLISAAGKLGRHGHRDATMILIAYRHGLRVSELVALRWDQVDLEQGLLHVRRRKNGIPSTHPLRGPELRRLGPLTSSVQLSSRRLSSLLCTNPSHPSGCHRHGEVNDDSLQYHRLSWKLRGP